MPLTRKVYELVRQTRLWRAVLYPVLLIVLYLATTAQAYPVPAASSDKVNHIMAFVVLGILLRWSYPLLSLGAALLGLAGYGLGIEIIQAFLPYRDFSLLDLLADTVGGIAGLLTGAAVLQKITRFRGSQGA